MFSGLLRPGQGFKPFTVYRRAGSTTPSGRPTSGLIRERIGVIMGIISQASPKDIEQHKQLGHPVTHTIVQYRGMFRANANDILVLEEDKCEAPRKFIVQPKPHDPGELGHFLIYHVEEREDL